MSTSQGQSTPKPDLASPAPRPAPQGVARSRPAVRAQVVAAPARTSTTGSVEAPPKIAAKPKSTLPPALPAALRSPIKGLNSAPTDSTDRLNRALGK